MSSAPYHDPYHNQHANYNQHSRQRSQSPRLALGRRTVAWLLVVLLLATVIPTGVFAMHALRSAAPSDSRSQPTQADTLSKQPADRFMQSIVTEDGALGWKQLCPSIQEQLPIGELVQQANAQRALMTQQGIHLTVRYVGSNPRQGGGAQRMYEVTAHWPTGRTEQRTFNVLTQPSGCVEDVTNQ